MRTHLSYLCILFSISILLMNRYPVTTARLCYDCLNVTPAFSDNNQVDFNGKYPPCFHHTNISCHTPRSKCFIEVKKQEAEDSSLYAIEKGCELDTKPDKCDSIDNGQGERCICSKRLCNADIQNAGGRFYKGLYQRGDTSGSGTMNRSLSSSSLFIYGLLAVLLFSHYIINLGGTGSLSCCVGTYELRKMDSEGRSIPCAKHGSSCENVGCQQNLCEQAPDYCTSKVCGSIEPSETETTTGEGNATDIQINKTPTTATNDNQEPNRSSRYLCRVLYYEVVTGKGNEVSGVALEGLHYSLQECYDTSPENGDGEVDLGCEFYAKPFYQDQYTRITHLKDCYCSQNDCNDSIVGVCNSTKNYTLSETDVCKQNGLENKEAKIEPKLAYAFLATLITLILQ